MAYVQGFGERLKQLRKERGLTQTELAKLIGSSKALVSKYETNQSQPPYEILIQIAYVFNVSTDYLLGIANRDYISVEGLSDRQMAAVDLMVHEFRSSYNSNANK